VERARNLHAFMIDDVQRLDPSSRAVLLRLGDRLFPQGHMFVCAARDDDASREQLERFRSALHGEQHATIALGPLNAEDASGLVAEYLGPRHLHAPDILAQLSSLSDGTPLSLLELLELLLENQSISARDGAWQLDAGSMRSMQLAASARALVERRIGQLGTERLAVLRAAAITRGHIDVALLSRVTGLDLERVQATLDDAALARMLELDSSGTPRFSHDTVWEVLLSGMSLDEQRALHQGVMQRMREVGPRDAADSFRLAQHCAAGVLEQDPHASFDTLWSAARLARAACDDALALTLLRPALQAARLGGLDPDASFFADLAEASLRVGELDSAFSSFEAAAERTPRGFERAHLLGRMAWIRHYHADGAPAIEMLKHALRECGQPFHSSSVAALGQTLARRVRTELGAGEQARLGPRQREILCGLYGKLVRVCMETAQGSQALVASLALADAARELPLCRARVEANALDAFAWHAVGAHTRSRRVFDEALSNAEWLRDPEAIASCHQLGHVLAAWQGDMAQSERHATSALANGGQHLDLGELCLLAVSMYTIESVRGRVQRALAWLEPAIERVRVAGHAPAMFMLVEEAACSGLISSDRQGEVVDLKSKLRFVNRARVECRGVLEQISFQFRVQNLLERDDPGPPLEQLIADFERLELDPKTVPPLVSVFYLHVAHARVHQCLRASAADRPGYVEKLRRAIVDVDLSTHVPPQHAHANVLRAAQAHFDGRPEQSEKWLCEAEKLARAENVPWVSYAAARLRAHALRARGKHEPARDQARVAAMYARQHGQLARLRFLSDELGLES
jgi:tetratricopeptide (TPR) repeat protein